MVCFCLSQKEENVLSKQISNLKYCGMIPEQIDGILRRYCFSRKERSEAIPLREASKKEHKNREYTNRKDLVLIYHVLGL